MAWFAVRHVVKNGSHYEERVTLWERGSFEEAMDAASREAAEYVKQFEEASLLDPLQAFELADPPGEGRECWSLIRRSDLDRSRTWRASSARAARSWGRPWTLTRTSPTPTTDASS